MRTNPKPGESPLNLRGQCAVLCAHTGRPGIGADRLEVEAGMLGVLPQQPVVFAGQPTNLSGQHAIMPPEVRSGRVPHGSGVLRPALNSEIARCASLSNGPPGRASSSICASQSSSQRRSRRAFNCHNSFRGNFSIAASISCTVLTGLNYRFLRNGSTFNLGQFTLNPQFLTINTTT